MPTCLFSEQLMTISSESNKTTQVKLFRISGIYFYAANRILLFRILYFTYIE